MNTTEAYERYLVPAIFVAMGKDLISRVAPAPGERVLDLACGTGIIGRPLAGTEAIVVGADFSPAMLAVARSLRQLAGASSCSRTRRPCAPLFEEAGFGDVEIAPTTQTIRFPSSWNVVVGTRS